jgi:hypothetical protein
MHHNYFLSLTQFHPQSLCYSKPINSVASLMPSSFLFAGGGGGGKRSRANMDGSSKNMRKLEAKIGQE